ncbi:hypothetical protein Tco_1427347 [Tanacetum coccineum]
MHLKGKEKFRGKPCGPAKIESIKIGTSPKTPTENPPISRKNQVDWEKRGETLSKVDTAEVVAVPQFWLYLKGARTLMYNFDSTHKRKVRESAPIGRCVESRKEQIEPLRFSSYGMTIGLDLSQRKFRSSYPKPRNQRILQTNTVGYIAWRLKIRDVHASHKSEKYSNPTRFQKKMYQDGEEINFGGQT